MMKTSIYTVKNKIKIPVIAGIILTLLLAASCGKKDDTDRGQSQTASPAEQTNSMATAQTAATEMPTEATEVPTGTESPASPTPGPTPGNPAAGSDKTASPTDAPSGTETPGSTQIPTPKLPSTVTMVPIPTKGGVHIPEMPSPTADR